MQTSKTVSHSCQDTSLVSARKKYRMFFFVFLVFLGQCIMLDECIVIVVYINKETKNLEIKRAKKKN